MLFLKMRKQWIILTDSTFIQFFSRRASCQWLGLHVRVCCRCLGFSRWNHGMEVISHSIPLQTVIRCRQCTVDPKGSPSVYFPSFQKVRKFQSPPG